MDVEFNKLKLSGELKIMSSKSISHRAIIAASLANNISIIKNVSISDDIKRTIDCLKNLGVEILLENNNVIVKGCKKFIVHDKLNAYESGSTLRFLIPLSLLAQKEVTFIGSEGLAKRPLDIYFKIFDDLDIKYSKDSNLSLPLKINGKLKPGIFLIDGSISSQFISGLLFALPLLDNDSKIIIKNNLESKAYVDLTLKVLKDFGISIINNNYKEFIIKAKQKYISTNYYIESDYSQAAFFIAANILGSNILIKGLNENSLQADKKMLDIISQMKINYFFKNDFLIVESKIPQATVIDLSECPDLGPILAVIASLSKGETKIINAKRLRIKESDRIKSISTELRKLGADIIELESGMIIKGKEYLNGGVVDSWNDHRIAMSLAIASLKCKNKVIIKNFSCINKSYPDFLKDLKVLGGIYEVI